MKTSNDPRHKKRIEKITKLFTASFVRGPRKKSIDRILPNVREVDEKIAHAAPEWPLDKIAKIDLAILRLATHELAFEGATPPKVVIDEAVELAKEYGNEHSSSFVNGVLGNILQSL
ncbi:MAG: transcription antitermination factor NusB [bacterium]|nr:transcription antitermination factor NusB [bacterium]